MVVPYWHNNKEIFILTKINNQVAALQEFLVHRKQHPLPIVKQITIKIMIIISILIAICTKIKMWIHTLNCWLIIMQAHNILITLKNLVISNNKMYRRSYNPLLKWCLIRIKLDLISKIRYFPTSNTENRSYILITSVAIIINISNNTMNNNFQLMLN